MMKSFFSLFAIPALLLIHTGILAQAADSNNVAATAKPYKVMTSGRQITIKSSKPVYHVMIWTTDGNRVAEQKEINSNSFSVTLPVSRRTFFLMVGLTNGKVYTEKIGVQ
jgi:hypothetical protein